MRKTSAKFVISIRASCTIGRSPKRSRCMHSRACRTPSMGLRRIVPAKPTLPPPRWGRDDTRDSIDRTTGNRMHTRPANETKARGEGGEIHIH